MLYYLKLYASTFAAFFLIDMIWLGFVARTFYRQQIGFLLTERPNWTAAFAFYFLFVAGLLVFVIVPSIGTGSLRKAILLGAFFGLVTYATYDLTNLATVAKWPIAVTIVDMLWGATLAAAVSICGFYAGRWLQ
jgi:uncharacterized membrane protein